MIMVYQVPLHKYKYFKDMIDDFFKKGYFESQEIWEFLRKHKGKIIVIVHVNNMSSEREKLIEEICKNREIYSLRIRIGILKKVVDDDHIWKLCGSPTMLFVFNNYREVLKFFDNKPAKSRLVPLAIHWGDKYYRYSYFRQRIDKYLKFEDFMEKLNVVSIIKRKIVVIKNIVKLFNARKLLQLFKIWKKK